MKGLDFLLSDEFVKVENQNETKTSGDKLNDLQITQYAVDRAFTYAKLVCEVTKQENECIGYLITPKGTRDRLVRDVYFPKEQEVTSASVEISPQQVIAAGRAIDEMGYRVLGWWHSHAGFGTFHSGIDERNQLAVLNAIAPVNYITRVNEKIIGKGNLEAKIENGKLVIFDKQNEGVKYEISVDRASGLSIAGMKILEEERVGFTYSLVVHNTAKKSKSFFDSTPSTPVALPLANTPGVIHGFSDIDYGLSQSSNEGILGKRFGGVQSSYSPIYTPAAPMSDEEIEIRKGLETRERHPYAEIATRTFCNNCKEIKDISMKVKLEVTPETRALDEDVMRKEVEDRIKRRPLFSFPGFGGYKGYGHHKKKSKSYSPYYTGLEQWDNSFPPAKPKKGKKVKTDVKIIPANDNQENEQAPEGGWDIKIIDDGNRPIQ